MSGNVKIRVGGVWQGMPVVRESAPGFTQRVVETASLDLNGGILSDTTLTETVNSSPITPTETTATVTLF